MFFEAVNEFGKDFESIQQYINAKLKKKGASEDQLKTKDHGSHAKHHFKHLRANKALNFSADVLYANLPRRVQTRKVFREHKKTCPGTIRGDKLWGTVQEAWSNH